MKKIVVGLDFDGVVAYNPARLMRLPVSFVKTHVLGVTGTSFFVPKTDWQRTLWALAHETSMFPALGTGYLRDLVRTGRIEAHLVTARFGFLERNLLRFLSRWNLTDVFTTITLNTGEEQPHLFKERIIRVKRFAYYIEDNWDIVSHLSRGKTGTEIHWIYNLFDRSRVYRHKHPYLKKALETIVRP